MDENQKLFGTAAVAQAGRGRLNSIFSLLAALGGKTSPMDQLEEELFRIREGFHNFRLDPVEKTPPDLDFLRSPRPPEMQLTYFARTMQRTQLVGHFVSDGLEVPVHYSITGAIILKREGRRFKVWDVPELTNNVLLPFSFVKRQDALTGFHGDDTLRLVDSGGTRPEYTQLRIAAVTKAMQLTLEHRQRIYERWRHQGGADLTQGLVVSGNLADVPNALLNANVLGIDRRVYLPWQNSQLLEPQLAIPAHQRGALLRVSKTEGPDPRAKYMWFVRLRSSAKADPEFGLANCICEATNDGEAIAHANAFTARLVDERLPVTFPAEGWDKLIFPLKLCKDYLESLVPTRETVKSYFARA
jgi:hypothetical protein